MKNPPGAMTMRFQLTHQSPRIRKPQIEPEPRSSRAKAMANSTYEYPIPEARPSTRDSPGGLERAKASARPMTMQLVMIRPT